MIRNYIKIAWRSLWKNKLQTGINLLGLTVGMVCCLSILVFVFAQVGYDTHHEDAESLYRINSAITQETENGINVNSATSSPPIAFAMKSDFPEVMEACRIVYFGGGNDALLRSTESAAGYYEPRGYVADPTFFSLFKYTFIEGKASEETLEAPNTVVLSETLSRKLFGSKSALNRTLELGADENAQTLTVVGVFEDKDQKSHLNPNYVMSMNSLGIGGFVRSVENFATQNFTHSYVKLVPGADASALEEKLPAFLEARGGKDLAESGLRKQLFLQPVTDIHLYSKGIENPLDKVSDIQFLYVLLMLALFIQLVACINFINLSTARANKRAKEIGVRKVIGADKGSLIRQFLGESLILSLGAALISIPLTLLFLPFLNELTQGAANFADVLDLKILLLLLGISVVTGILAGTYPALVMSSIKPIRALKGAVNTHSGSGNFRKALVVFQFVISIALIAAVTIITQQLKYAQGKDLGFDKENLIAIRLENGATPATFNAIKTEMLSISGVQSASGSNFYPSEQVKSDYGIHLPGTNPMNKTLVKTNGVSDNYFETSGIPLITGRQLQAQDEQQVVVNEATLEAFNIDTQNAVGSKLLSSFDDEIQEFKIVGVAQDFHFASLKEVIAPMMLYYQEVPNWLLVKVKTMSYERTLGDIESTWKATNPNAPFVYNFVDENVRELYAEERRLSKISMIFTGLAILISCLGLFGLVSFVAEQKKKEIGVRKVLGASVNNLVRLLTSDFLKLVAIAFLIAVPLAYFLMQNWLQDFTYRIEISWWVFALAGLAALTITTITVAFQAIKAAVANPVKSLRTE